MFNRDAVGKTREFLLSNALLTQRVAWSIFTTRGIKCFARISVESPAVLFFPFYMQARSVSDVTARDLLFARVIILRARVELFDSQNTSIQLRYRMISIGEFFGGGGVIARSRMRMFFGSGCFAQYSWNGFRKG